MSLVCPKCGSPVEPCIPYDKQLMVGKSHRNPKAQGADEFGWSAQGGLEPYVVCWGCGHGRAFPESDCRTDVLSQKDKAVGPDDIPW